LNIKLTPYRCRYCPCFTVNIV